MLGTVSNPTGLVPSVNDFLRALPNLKNVAVSLKRLSGNLRQLHEFPEKFPDLTGSVFKNVGISLNHVAKAVPSAQDANGDLNVLKLKHLDKSLQRAAEAINKVSEFLELIFSDGGGGGASASDDDSDLEASFKKIVDGTENLARALRRVNGVGALVFGLVLKQTGTISSIKDVSTEILFISNLREIPQSFRSTFKRIARGLLNVEYAMKNLMKVKIN